LKNYHSVPIKHLDEFVSGIESVITSCLNRVTLVLFGHIGDGNIHFNYVGNSDITRDEFFSEVNKAKEIVYKNLQKYGGSVSAEHGIGLLKKNDLKYTCSEIEIDAMKKIKSVLDPKGILNPGKIF
ncbi:MAG: FAD-binding oxidoreductase, partial [Oligoflexales bacterium]|nr:FAD-binding oxidoreductase [Oligoflexales bacterium]